MTSGLYPLLYEKTYKTDILIGVKFVISDAGRLPTYKSNENTSLVCYWHSLYLITNLLTYLLTYLLTPWSKVLLEKLTVPQPVKKFPALYGTRSFFSAFTSARHLSPSLSQLDPPGPIWGIKPKNAYTDVVLVLFFGFYL